MSRPEASQRKLSLSSRDDPNYKGINAVAGAAHRYALMRSRATSPGTLMQPGKCLPACLWSWLTTRQFPGDRGWWARIDLLQKPDTTAVTHPGRWMPQRCGLITAVVEVVKGMSDAVGRQLETASPLAPVASNGRLLP